MPISERIPWFTHASREKRWLVGVSGGADSVALLHLMVEQGFQNLVICHLDHQLRGLESREDAEFVRDIAGKLGIPMESASADVEARMQENSESLETAARNARHRFFSGCAEKYQCPQVLLAHHADDQAETVLWNLSRGSHGLKGMRAEQEIVTETGVKLQLIRPLLGIRRAELKSWLEAGGHDWREDASNAEPVAIRNRLRNEAIPLLVKICGRDLVPALCRGAEDSEEMEVLGSWALEKACVLDPQGRLHVPVMRSLPVALRRIALRKFLLDNGVGFPDRDLIERGLGMLDGGSASSVNLPGGRRLRRREARLWIDG